MMDNGWGAGSWLVMSVLMLIFWTLVVVAVVWVVRASTPERPTVAATSEPDTPLAILDARYARGELTEDEYRHRRDVLLTS